MPPSVQEMEVQTSFKFEKFSDNHNIDQRFLQRVPAISSHREETSPPRSACLTGEMDVRLRSGSMSSAYQAEYEESDSESDRDCNAIDMSVIKSASNMPMGDRAMEQMEIDIPACGRSRMMMMMDPNHGPPPPQLIIRDPHAPREDLRKLSNISPLSSSTSSSPALHVKHENLKNGMAGPPLPPPPFLSQLGQPSNPHLLQQQMQQQQQHHGGMILTPSEIKGRHSSFSSVISSDGAVSPPPHTLPTPSITPHSGTLSQHQLAFVPQHIPPELMHKMSSGQKKKLPTPIPKECKDEAYWERRKRNNESAKRSRELRRIKEQQTTLRVMYLEQENMGLRAELAVLRTDIDKLRNMLYLSGQSNGGRNNHQADLSEHEMPARPAALHGRRAAAAAAPPPPPSDYQPLPPITTLQQPSQMRRIIMASPRSRSRTASHIISRSPSPRGRISSHREFSISPHSSEATDLSPLPPQRVAQTPSPAKDDEQRNRNDAHLELGQPASDAQMDSHIISESSCQSHSSGGSCSPPSQQQQLPLQPAILRHKKARPSSPSMGVCLMSSSTHNSPIPCSSSSSNSSSSSPTSSSSSSSQISHLHPVIQREFSESHDVPPRGIDAARLRERNYEPRLVAPPLAAA